MRTKIWILIIFLAIFETFAMSTIEYSANNKNKYYIFGIFLYSITAYILYRILITEKLAITNALWNSITIILVSIVSIFYFKEKLSKYQIIGLLLAILSVIFMEMKSILKIIK